MTYAEFLAENGALPEDIKIMDTAVARKAFEKQQTMLTDAANRAEKAEQLKAETDKWYYDTHLPEYQTMQNSVVTAQAEAARYKAAIVAAEKQGLVNIAKDLGFNPDAPVTPVTPVSPDMSKYATNDLLLQVAEREGDAIAAAQDIAAEHSILFPGQRLSFRELRKEAMTRKIPVEQLWMDKYKVSEARTARETAAREQEQRKWRDEGAAAARAEFAVTGNPDITHPSASRSPFTQRASGDPRQGKQPWESPSEHVLSDDRVKKVASKIAVGNA